jgi:maltose-binding protein MalE
MKKTIFFALLTIFSLSAVPTFAAKSSTNATETTTEASNKLTEEEMSALTTRVKEIRDMDKSEMTSGEKSELKSELKDINKTMKSNEPYVYIGGSTLLIIILLLILL